MSNDFQSFTFAKQKEHRMDKLEDFAKILTEYNTFNAINVKLGELKVNDDFSLEYNQEKFTPTKEAALVLCNQLGMPEYFTKSIPRDLLMENVHRLIAEWSSRKATIIVDTANNRFVDVGRTKADRLTLPHTVLENFPMKDNYKFDYGVVNDRYYSFNVIDTNFPQIVIPEKKHATEMGISVNGKTVGFGIIGQPYMMQVVCGNGMIAPRSFGHVKMIGSGQRRLENFFHNLETIYYDSAEFQRRYDEIVKANMKDDRFTVFWRKLRRILAEADVTDALFGVDQEARKSYIARGTENKKHDKPQEDTAINYYDVYYKVTEEAQKQPSVERLNLMQLAGTFLEDFKPN